MTDVLVTDDVIVRDGAVLTVAAGVTVTFRGHLGILVRDGAIDSRGTVEAPVVWTTDRPELFTHDDRLDGCWNGITLLNVPAAALPSRFERNVFQYAKCLVGSGLDDDAPRKGGRAPEGAGGALRLVGGDPVELVNCIFRHNASWRGGALTTHYGAAPTLANCLFLDNSGEMRAGAVYASYSRPRFIHTTMTGNASRNTSVVVRTAGAVDSFHGAPRFTGCILWGNTTHHHDLYQILEPRVPDVRWCDLEGQAMGQGGMDLDPLLGSAGVPRPGSPCIDAGHAYDAGPWLPATDLAGRDRIIGTAPDMGCYEFDPTTAAPAPPARLRVEAWPNPANPGTTVRWTLPTAGPVLVTLHDLAGRRVRTLADGPAAAGPGERHWNGRDDGGRPLASGHYRVRVRVPGGETVGGVALVR